MGFSWLVEQDNKNTKLSEFYPHLSFVRLHRRENSASANSTFPRSPIIRYSKVIRLKEKNLRIEELNPTA
jgi:hypothetical protein